MQQKYCPKCNSSSRRRKRKKGFLKLIPLTRYYRCGCCHATYLWLSAFNTPYLIESGVMVDSDESLTT